MQRFFGGLGRLLAEARFALRRGWAAVANTRRRLLRKQLPDYVVLVLDRALTERSPLAPWWYGFIPGRRPPLSLESLAETLHHVAGDEQVRGVLLLVKEPALSLAQAQSMAALFARFRARSAACTGAAQEILVHLEQVSTPAYVMACAADGVTMAPLADWSVLGLRSNSLFFKDALARLGVHFDVMKIAPWKTAADSLSRSCMSEAQREQTEWLLDSLFGDIVTAIAQGRALAESTVRDLVDRAPLSAAAAQEAGLVDRVLYEDELSGRLGEKLGREATMRPYAEIKGLLRRRPVRRHRRKIGVISLTGAIAPGRSRRFPIPIPLLGEETLGSSTAQHAIRAAREDRSLAAVVVHVDSPGGSALASDLIWRELTLLDAEKPVVVYMGDVAASGGYYIAAPGRHVVAQRATLTGSIGVIIAKAVVRDAYAKAQIGAEGIQRGDHAAIFRADAGWSESERQTMEEAVRTVYTEFKERVAAGRKLPLEELDSICNGRVWTGAQALEHGLVDELGDFQAAVDAACAAAELSPARRVRVVPIKANDDGLLAKPLEQTDALGELLRGDWLRLLGRERYWLLADDLPILDK